MKGRFEIDSEYTYRVEQTRNIFLENHCNSLLFSIAVLTKSSRFYFISSQNGYKMYIAAYLGTEFHQYSTGKVRDGTDHHLIDLQVN